MPGEGSQVRKSACVFSLNARSEKPFGYLRHFIGIEQFAKEGPWNH
jgi:hypothetical protein